MTRSLLWCRTSIVQSSALVQASSSLSMGSTRSVATGRWCVFCFVLLNRYWSLYKRFNLRHLFRGLLNQLSCPVLPLSDVETRCLVVYWYNILDTFLYCNSARAYSRLIKLYSIISGIVDSLPANTKTRKKERKKGNRPVRGRSECDFLILGRFPREGFMYRKMTPLFVFSLFLRLRVAKVGGKGTTTR